MTLDWERTLADWEPAYARGCNLNRGRLHIPVPTKREWWERATNPATPIDVPGPAACRYDDHSGA